MQETADEGACHGVALVPSSGALALIAYSSDGPRTISLRQDEQVVIGRATSCQLVLSEPTLSRQHARVSRSQDRVWVEDLGSRHGIWSSGERIDKVELQLGSTVRLSNVLLALIASADLPMSLRPITQAVCTPPLSSNPESLRRQVKLLERSEVARALKQAQGNQRRAAALLGLPLRTFERRVRALRES